MTVKRRREADAWEIDRSNRIRAGFFRRARETGERDEPTGFRSCRCGDTVGLSPNGRARQNLLTDCSCLFAHIIDGDFDLRFIDHSDC